MNNHDKHPSIRQQYEMAALTGLCANSELTNNGCTEIASRAALMAEAMVKEGGIGLFQQLKDSNKAVETGFEAELKAFRDQVC